MYIHLFIKIYLSFGVLYNIIATSPGKQNTDSSSISLTTKSEVVVKSRKCSFCIPTIMYIAPSGITGFKPGTFFKISKHAAEFSCRNIFYIIFFVYPASICSYIYYLYLNIAGKFSSRFRDVILI